MSILNKIEGLADSALDTLGYELVDIQLSSENGKKVLRVFLDKPEGIKLDDCEQVSSKLGMVIDESGIIGDSYILEVSSPGLDRVLKKEKDFIKFNGKKVKVSVYSPIGGQRNFGGFISGLENGVLVMKDASSGKEINIELKNIARARLEPDFSTDLKS